MGSGPYEKIYPGHDVLSQFLELEPHKSLDADRPRVVGTGSWDATDFLSPELCMAYRYPDSLLFDDVPQPGEYPQTMDTTVEVIKIAKVWDVCGLLHAHDHDIQSSSGHELARVFNILQLFENAECDRQIGDRRGRNAVEKRLASPSSSLPTGPGLLDFWIDAKVNTLSIVCADRRDFYHQFATSLSRTQSNTVGPQVLLRDLEGTRAYEHFLASKKDPETATLPCERPAWNVGASGLCKVSIRSWHGVFQKHFPG